MARGVVMETASYHGQCQWPSLCRHYPKLPDSEMPVVIGQAVLAWSRVQDSIQKGLVQDNLKIISIIEAVCTSSLI